MNFLDTLISRLFGTLIGWTMIISIVLFLITFIIAFITDENQRSSTTLKFAPTTMTAFGLFGTFLELTHALQLLGGGNGNVNFDSNTVQNFVESLGGVFIYSIAGIGSAILFMVCNLIITAKNNKKKREEKIHIFNEIADRNSYLDDLNETSVKELQNQSQLLSRLYQQNQNNLAPLATLGSSIDQMTVAVRGMAQGYDTEALGNIISQKVQEALQEPLNNIAQALSTNNSDTIRQLLADLKDEVLIPIKGEIQSTTQATNQVTQAVQKSQETNEQLIAKLGETTAQMTSFVNNTQSLVQTMVQTVKNLDTMQQQQQETLHTFNQELKTNLNTIEPAIVNGLTTTKTEMVSAIGVATTAMNTALTGVVAKLTNDVVNELGSILGKFDSNMDGHLNRMNQELEATGTRSSKLIDQSANSLKTTMGEIDQTLASLSEKLQTELQAFRNEYTDRLNEFFEKQNTQLEETLGVHSHTLQKSALDFGETFNEMTKTQGRLNSQTTTTFEPLLTQMSGIAKTLHRGHGDLVQGMSTVIEQNQNINTGLEKLGNELATSFTERFETLNNKYIERHNESNQALKAMLGELTTAAALLTASYANHNYRND